MADREKNSPLSTGSVNFNFCLNRQGAQGKKGERGDEGFSPYITQGKNTLDEYTMIVTNENGSFETPNLREHKEDRGGTYFRYDRDTGIGYVGDANQATPELKGEIRIATQKDFDRLSGDTAVTPETLSSANPLKLGYIDDRDETESGYVAYVEYKTDITGDANRKTISFESSFVAEKWANGIRDDVSKYYLLGQNSVRSSDGSIKITKVGKTLDLRANSQGYVLPAANATTLGGIKAETKTDAETNEVKIDPATSKLYVAGGGSTPTNYVTTDTEQQITAQKEFTTTIKVSDDIVTSEGLRIASGGLGARMVSLGDSKANLTIYSNGAPQVVTYGDTRTLLHTGNIGNTAVTLDTVQTIRASKIMDRMIMFSDHPAGIMNKNNQYMMYFTQQTEMIGQQDLYEVRLNAQNINLDSGNGVKRILSEDDLIQINQDVSELGNELNQLANDVKLKYGEGLSVEDGKLVACPKNFMLKFGKTDLNESIVNTTVFDLCSVLTLADNQAFANVDPSNYNLTGATLKLPVPTALNAANTNGLINYDIDVRITGTIAGSANTARDFTIELRRPNGDKIESHSVVKVATNDLNSKGVLFSTYTLGANDPFITDGFNLVLNNTSGQTITLTGVTILIKGQGG